MLDSDVLLIAGLGPGHLENEDLKGSYFDNSINLLHRDKFYQFDGENYALNNLYFKNKEGDIVPVLRPIKKFPPELIVTTLCSILRQANIDFKFENISCIWDEKNCHYVVNTVCLSTTFMWSERMIDVAMEWLKKNVVFKYLVVGGQYSVLKKDYILKNYPYVNYLITGDAEISLVPLLREIKYSNVGIDNIPNIIYRGEGGKLFFTNESFGDINLYETPKYIGSHDTIPYISMKGCVYNCKFCALSFCARKWRYRSAKNIYKDWKYFKEHNDAKHIDINDSTFFIPYAKVIELLPLVKNLNLTWEANARSDTPFTKDDVKKLEEAGCKALFFGFESMSDTVLGYINKKTTSKQNRKINAMFATSSIDTMMSFIVGFPGETLSEFRKTYNYLVNEHYGHFNIYVFEFEDKSMPIWQDAEKFKIKVFEDQNTGWEHGGENWSHIGMTSIEAKKLRKELLHAIRISDKSRAIHKSWQYMYEDEFITANSRHVQLAVERLLDKLAYVSVDYMNSNEIHAKIKFIASELSKYGIYPLERLSK